MPAFQQSYPELDAQPPVMEGETATPPTPLKRMRRQQLHDLARAWDIPVENGGTKDKILPILMAAEETGTFRLPPKNPEFARKAMRNSDEPPFPPLKAGECPIGPTVPVKTEMPDYRGMDMTQLGEACRAKGIDNNRRGGDWMIKQLEAFHAA